MNLGQVVLAGWLFLLCARSLWIYMAAQRQLIADLEQQRRAAAAAARLRSASAPTGRTPMQTHAEEDNATQQPPTAPPIAWAWMLMIMVQCLVNIAASLTQCNPLKAAFFDTGGLLLGISVALTWFNGMRLFEYSPRYYLLVSGVRHVTPWWLGAVSDLFLMDGVGLQVHSLSHGLPSVARFTLGCVPIFMAYVGASTVFFGRISNSFGSIGETVTT